MAAVTLSKIPATKAAEICEHVALGDRSRDKLRPDSVPADFLNALIGEGLYLDAARFLAHALPKQEAVWWACQCARSAAGQALPEPAAAALAAAELWVEDPTDEHRRAALIAAETAGIGTPAGCTALAAFLSGGSLAPENCPEVPPASHLTGRSVAGAITIAAVSQNPEKMTDKLQAFVASGLDVASGKSHWKPR
jgi:hypothetical protein